MYLVIWIIFQDSQDWKMSAVFLSIEILQSKCFISEYLQSKVINGLITEITITNKNWSSIGFVHRQVSYTALTNLYNLCAQTLF